MYYNISIDGPSGAGKSTIARALAEKIGFEYLDTGAMYRAVTFAVLDKRIDLKDNDALQNFLESLSLDVIDNHVIMNGVNLDRELRSKEVTDAVSKVSSLPMVREKLVSLQREIASNKSIILDGRDIGSVVLPQADVKFFLTATPEERAKRRFEQLKGSEEQSFEEILSSIKKRDQYDSTRKESPLVKTKDMIEVDSTDRSIHEVLTFMMDVMEKKNVL